MTYRAALSLVALVLMGCTRAATPDPVATKEPPPPSPSSVPPDATIDPVLAAELREIFATYKQWGRVDDEFRWAPWLCRMPEPARPSMSRASGGGHAKKLYSLFAKDRAAYVGLSAPNAAAPAVGQVIVKESWIPEIVKDTSPDDRRGTFGSLSTDVPEMNDHFDRYRRDGDTLYRAASLAGAYVMWKKPRATPGTDDGWAYGTVTPDGVVTSAGRVESCMGCHSSAKYERLFGRAAAAD